MDFVSAEKAINDAAHKQLEPQEFLEAYDKFASGLYRFALFKVNRKEVAEDLVAQTFFKTWEYLQKGQAIEYWKVFLYRTLNNLIVDYYRARHLEPILLESSNDSSVFEFIDENHLPEKLHRNSEAQLIVNAFSKLPHEQKDILLWRYVNDLSIADIASLTGKKRSAVYVTIHRALNKIKKMMQKKTL